MWYHFESGTVARMIERWGDRGTRNFHKECFNPLKLSGNYVYHLLYQSLCAFCTYGSCMILSINSDHFLKQR